MRTNQQWFFSLSCRIYVLIYAPTFFLSQKWMKNNMFKVIIRSGISKMLKCFLFYLKELEKTVAICCAATTPRPSTTIPPLRKYARVGRAAHAILCCWSGNFNNRKCPYLTGCSEDQHMCGGSNPRCIPSSFVCDGLSDCDDQSDESRSLCG